MEAAVETLFERALEHHALGRDGEAKEAYLAVLRADATHLGALNNLGTLLFNAGYRTAAITAYRQAVVHHPADTMARVNLANALYDAERVYEAREHYEAAIAADAACLPAHRGIAMALDKLGEPEAAALHRDLGYRGNATAVVPYRGQGRPIVVLLLVSAVGGNVNTDRFLDDRTFFVTKLFAEYYDAGAFLPFHDLLVNAIGDAELSPLALDRACEIAARTNAPVVNRPEMVRLTSRPGNAARLANVQGVVAPLTRRYPRAVLAGDGGAERLARDGFAFPLLLRTPGFHTGEFFLKVDSPDDLRDAVEQLPGNELNAIEFLDARVDGTVRKYRVMIVGGALYPLHLAISSDWKVHYFTAGMRERPEYRAQEAAFLADMPGVVGAHGVAALESIARTLDLDYAGIDFALDANGNVLVFEANAPMMVPPPDPDEVFAYRREATERIFSAVRALLTAGRTNP